MVYIKLYIDITKKLLEKFGTIELVDTWKEFSGEIRYINTFRSLDIIDLLLYMESKHNQDNMGMGILSYLV